MTFSDPNHPCFTFWVFNHTFGMAEAIVFEFSRLCTASARRPISQSATNNLQMGLVKVTWPTLYFGPLSRFWNGLKSAF